jgi:hypothetical protein
MNKSGEVCWLNKSGGLSMEAGEVLQCVNLAYERVKIWTTYLEDQLRAYEIAQNKDTRHIESTAENERYMVPPREI